MNFGLSQTERQHHSTGLLLNTRKHCGCRFASMTCFIRFRLYRSLARVAVPNILLVATVDTSSCMQLCIKDMDLMKVPRFVLQYNEIDFQRSG